MPEIYPWHWLAFGALVVLLLLLDLFVFHRHAHTPSMRESVAWTVFWIALALVFNGLIWWWAGDEAAVRFLTGYVLEKALSVDNIFVFLVIFRFFQVPVRYQYRVLFWGILGAVVMRLVFILVGTRLIEMFDWMKCVFGVFLIYTGAKLAMHAPSDVHPENNIVLRTARRWFRVTSGDHREHGERFFVRREGRLYITPLLLVLLVIESTDVLFAVDSVPAIIGITGNPFLVFSSNVFAILGLRALYFVLAGLMDMFLYLHYGLSVVLGFIGVKMMADFAVERKWLWKTGHEFISPWTSLAIVGLILAVSILASAFAKRESPSAPSTPDEAPSDPPA